MITIVMIFYCQAKAYHLPDKFKGNKEEYNEGKKEGQAGSQAVWEGELCSVSLSVHLPAGWGEGLRSQSLSVPRPTGWGE